MDQRHHGQQAGIPVCVLVGAYLQVGSDAPRLAAISSTASRDWLNVATLTTLSPSGMWPMTSLQLSAGARNHMAPPLLAPTSFCWIPPVSYTHLTLPTILRVSMS